MVNMENQLFNLKFAAKELQRNSKKCDREQEAEKAKIKEAIQKGNKEVAKIHAVNAVHKKNQSLNYLSMSHRVDTVAVRAQTAMALNKVTRSLASVVRGNGATLKKFEDQFETPDVQMANMEDTMSSTTTLTTPQHQVEALMQEMADEAGLELNMQLPPVSSTAPSDGLDDLYQRLAKLQEKF